MKNILYEDNDILVAYKPAGIATQTSRIGQQDMVSELKNYLVKAQKEEMEGCREEADFSGAVSWTGSPSGSAGFRSSGICQE